ncbi:MAG: stage II sporulation protein M, partial [Thermosphaera sp.]
SAETLRNATIHELSMRIFFNNAGIALASIVPFIGTIPMTMGVGNAGVLIGAIIPERLAIGDYTPLLIYIMPHAILELLAYSFFVTSAFELKTSRALRLIIVGLLTLGLAAVVEALSIKILG